MGRGGGASGGRGGGGGGGAAEAGEDFGPSGADVRLDPDDPAGVRKAAEKLFGKKLADRDYASVVGAPDGSRVTVSVSEGHLLIFVRGDQAGGFTASREVYRTHDGKLVVKNHSFFAEETGTGLGVRVFGRQVEQAAKLGVKEIRTFAAKGDDLVQANGYYTWARFGYDGHLTAGEKSAAGAAGFKGAAKVSDLMKSEGGRQWWKKNGDGKDMTFDLAAGGQSRRVLSGYLKEKGLAK